MSEAELIHSLNYKNEMLFNVIDTYDNQVYPIKKKDPEKFNEIMTQVYKRTHKTELSGKKLDNWVENFPNMIDRKIQAEKTKLKKKQKSPGRVKKGKEIYITSPLRNQNILNKMDKLGYYSINANSKREKMKAGLKDDEIIADLVEEISDPYGGDHDLVEIDYNKQFENHLDTYKERYKYVYAVEDVKPKKKDVLIRKDIISIPKRPKKEVDLKEKRTVKMTPVKKPIKEKIKLFSSIILSENPIKITPAEKLEYVKEKPVVKKKPIKKAPIKKKKPPIKKKPIVKKKIIKKVAIPKKKPVVKKKPISKKLPVKKKKPTVKKRPISKKKPVKKSPGKKKPVPKKKPTMRAKKRNSPITGRWTARYRMVGGKRKKVKIRRWKGKIQTRIIN